MKLQVPVINDDGSVEFVADLTPGEAQVLLQFGLNLAITAGLAQFISTDKEEKQLELDFPISEETTVQ